MRSRTPAVSRSPASTASNVRSPTGYCTWITCDPSLSPAYRASGWGCSQVQLLPASHSRRPAAPISIGTPKAAAAASNCPDAPSGSRVAASCITGLTMSRSVGKRARIAGTAAKWSRFGWLTMTASRRRTPAARNAGATVRIPSDDRSRLPASKTTATSPCRRMWQEPSPTSSMTHSRVASCPWRIAAPATPVHPTASRPKAARRTGQSRLRHHATAATLTIAAQAQPTRPTSRSGTCHRDGSSAIQSKAPVR